MSKDHISPHASGLFRPQIVISESSLGSFDSETWENVFFHEMSHIKDKDSLWLAFEILSRRFLFFNPLIYLVQRRHLMTLEKAADEQAIRTGGLDPVKYIKTLISVLNQTQSPSKNPLAVNASKNFLEIKERIESISRIHHPNLSQVKYCFVVLMCFTLATGLSWAHATKAVNGLRQELSAGMMCTQVMHEKFFESLLQIEPAANKCENEQTINF